MALKKPSAVYRNRMTRYSDHLWLIWSNKWAGWFRPNACGYTDDLERAGLFSREEAARYYPGDVPRQCRDNEPFPLSSVVPLMRARIHQLTEDSNELARYAQRLERLLP